MLDIIKQEIKNHALLDNPNEAAGFILNDLITYKCKNSSDTPKTKFLITPQETENAQKLGKITSYYHSHTEGEEGISLADKYIAERKNINCIVYDTKRNEFYEYSPYGMEIPYVGREFLLGVIDCYQLVRDYYKKELNIELSDIIHPSRSISDWVNSEYNNKNNIYQNFLLERGFKVVNELKKHDIILTRLAKLRCASHSAIFLGDGFILHHLPENLSKIEPYSNLWRKLSVNYFRHSSLL